MSWIPHSQWLSLQSIIQTSTVFYMFLYYSLHRSLVITTVTSILVPQPQPASLVTVISTPLSLIPLGSYRILNFFVLRSQLLHIAVEGSCVCPHLPNCLNSKLSDTSSDRSSHTQQSSWQGSPHCAEMQLPRQMYAFILSPYFKITLWEDTERYIKCSFCDRSCIPSCWKW